MASIPRAEAEASLAFLREGYLFIPRRCDRLGSDLFETRIALKKVVCMRGPAAAHVLYDADRFTRRGAMPPTTLRLLQDRGSVQLMDDAAHRHRKGLFLDLLAPGRATGVAGAVGEAWRAALEEWRNREEVVLHDAAREVLCRGGCAWAGVPLPEEEVERRTRELGAMIDGAGSVGPRNWWAQVLRARSERWARGVVEAVRAGELEVGEDRALGAVARFRDPDGELLPAEVAAVELLNLLRPIVAVARFITFAALALHENPGWRSRVADAGDDVVERFVQEVRRFYPFFPAVGGRARRGFEDLGYYFPEGRWALLDLYGTNRHPAVWDEPHVFRPERFEGWDGDPDTLIPQGAGDHATGHRCPGEWATIELMKEAAGLLTTDMEYDVPPQDTSIDLSEMPALPASGLRIRVR